MDILYIPGVVKSYAVLDVGYKSVQSDVSWGVVGRLYAI